MSDHDDRRWMEEAFACGERASGRVAAAGEALPRLGLPLIQRIVGLHGGQIRVNTSDQGMVQMLMEFPTGAPARGQASVGIAQAQRYAQDLAQLMSRRKKEKV